VKWLWSERFFYCWCCSEAGRLKVARPPRRDGAGPVPALVPARPSPRLSSPPHDSSSSSSHPAGRRTRCQHPNGPTP